MKKILCLISLLTLSINAAFAGNQLNRTLSDELLDRFKYNRSTIYAYLKLTEDQRAEVKKVDELVYTQLKPELEQIAVYIKQVENIANSDDCTVKKINAIKKDFKATDKNISTIKVNYDKEFNQILNRNQKSWYKKAKRYQRAKLKKEIKRIKTVQNSH